jgi:hypothetical protein
LRRRKANRERPIIGDRRPPSSLGDIQPDHWLAEYTSELVNVLHVLGGSSLSNRRKPSCSNRSVPALRWPSASCARRARSMCPRL